MYKILNAIAASIATLLFVGMPIGVPPRAQPAPVDSEIILRYNGTPLRGGRWSFVKEFQDALNVALVGCGIAPIGADGSFGRGSRAAVTKLGGCPGFGGLEVGAGERNASILTQALWQKLLPDEPMPDALERAHVIWLTHEATDYGKAEFNFTSTGQPQPNDRFSYLTWGPFGATVGHGREVQKILAIPAANAEIGPCFDGEANAVQTLLAASDPGARDLLRQVVVDPDRRKRWSDGFECLGAKPQVRAAYDSFALDTDQWLRPAVRRLEGLVGPDPVTGIDYALFVDLAMHMSISPNRISAARQALADREQQGDSLSASERRQIIGQTLVSMLGNQVEDRRGRNVVFYIDGLGADRLSPQEIAAWKHRSAFRASDVGLSDAPIDR